MKTGKKLMAAVLIVVAVAIAGTAIAGYTTYTPITNVSITSHNDYDSVYVGQEYTLTSTTSTDKDCHNGSHTHSDPIVHTWSGPGTFDPQTGTTVTWIPPRATGNVTITVTASDNGSPVYANDTDKSDSVILTVENNLYYVDADANGNDDGTSWTDAFNYLQDALDAVSSGDEIWVADGNYYPDEGNSVTDNDRSETFQLVSSVGVYGGFNATETARSERDWATNETILSGDIDKNSVLDSNNSYHVAKGAGSATLDGFTITMGYADSEVQADLRGAGMYCSSDSGLTVGNCVFTDNYAVWGAGLYNEYDGITVTNCEFTGNSANDAGAIYTFHDSSTITNCEFTGNTAVYNTGGVACRFDTSPTIRNCVFTSNVGSHGAALHLWDAAATVVNCTFIGNCAVTSSGDGGALYLTTIPFDPISSTVTNCVFWANSARDLADEICNVGDSTLTISYCDIEGGWNGSGVYTGSYATTTDGGGNLNTDPGLTNLFDFSGSTSAAGTTTTIKVPDASLYSVDDEIEYDDDGVLRKVTAVNTTTDIVTFADDALDSASVSSRAVFNWGSGATDPNEDLHLTSNSACMETGDQSGSYTGQKDIDGDDRVIDGDNDSQDEVDIGADEYNPS